MNINKIVNISKSERFKIYRDTYREFRDAETSLTEFCKQKDISRVIARTVIDIGKVIEDLDLYYD